MNPANRKYWLGFSRASGIGAVRLRSLLDRFGDVAAAWNAGESALLKAGIGEHAARGLIEARRTIALDQEMDRLAGSGFRMLIWEDPEYPAQLLEIASPPICLYIWGDLKPSDQQSVAIVGTRRPSPYGQAVARDVATALAVHDVAVVSGLARGVDSIAHRAALDAGGRTLAVLGSGLDQIYPPEHAALAAEIAGQGAVLTEFALGVHPDAANFPIRNRIVAGLTRATVVVEAGEASGALITADLAADQGREVFAVPGSIYNRASRGTNRLILSGATPMASPEDVLEALHLPVESSFDDPTPVQEGPGLEADLAVLLTDEPMHADDLVARTRRSSSDVMAALAMLELQGRAVHVGGMHFVRARRAARATEVKT